MIHVAVSDSDRERMAKLSMSLRLVESHTPASQEQRRRLRAWANPRRIEIGLPPLEEEDEPPEVELVRRARVRGLLRDDSRGL